MNVNNRTSATCRFGSQCSRLCSHIVCVPGRPSGDSQCCLLQEARVSRAVELMLAHVENLRRQHDKNVSDLEEAKKLIQQQSILSPKACSGVS